MSPLNESQVRQLRDNIYGPSTDGNWQAVRAEWMKPEETEWLLRQPQNAAACKSAPTKHEEPRTMNPS